MFLSPHLEDAIATWKKFNKCQQFEEELDELLKENNEEKLSERFLNRLDFGTAGLRGRMGCGFNAMNDVVVIQAAQGLLDYANKTIPEAKSRGIVIGYDSRHWSRRFAELTAAVFLTGDYQVNFFSEEVPTPFVPFSVRVLKAAIGVMVTASHNPKDDNGYKVYWENSVQIISPHDKGIKAHIIKHLEPRESSWKTGIISTHKNLIDSYKLLLDKYIERRLETSFSLKMNRYSQARFTYTAMHGIGYKYIVEVFKCLELKPVFPVMEQIDPDPEFSTVKFPNPEEGESALEIAIQTANKNGSSVIIANDPDADRLAIAEKIIGRDDWKIFSGNEIGALLGWWLLENFKKKNPSKKNFSDCYFISSTVSSRILETIAKTEHLSFEETLTGFKWIGNKAFELMEKKKHVIFAFEESIGFMCDSECLDKDGISAAAKVAELFVKIQDTCMSLQEKLDEIYDQYGHHLNVNSYFFCYEKETVAKIFKRLRTWLNEEKTYPESIADGRYQISGIRDLTAGYDSTKPDNVPTLPVSKSSEMITFYFDNGFTCTLRTSGTEPKIKYYAEMIATPDQKDVRTIHDTLNEIMNFVIEEFLHPSQNKLIPKAN